MKTLLAILAAATLALGCSQQTSDAGKDLLAIHKAYTKADERYQALRQLGGAAVAANLIFHCVTSPNRQADCAKASQVLWLTLRDTAGPNSAEANAGCLLAKTTRLLFVTKVKADIAFERGATTYQGDMSREAWFAETEEALQKLVDETNGWCA
ncbi:hypothetical protein ACG04Q_19235 [Roseateles sp. DXS20W]|uniref:Lipoprotein n=1 Tax=Pelomonas lactea TaxID=3299030 RepID=A0ABW7GP17_9BURK